ncbi:MAG: type II secretion system F family protein [Candidatus Aenigmarchaeota archaeon]|nr:type II secretion system F family protein [Candidatus Aenigmarchaeota archaeon]
MKRVPLVPFPLETVKKFSRFLIGFGDTFSMFFPGLDWDLEQSQMEMEPREWTAVALFSSLFYFIMLGGLMLFITAAAGITGPQAIGVSLLVGFSISSASFFYISMYPKLMAKKKVKNLNENLPHALHHLLIQIRSGVPLFNCLVSISKAGYGELSKVFERAVNEINTGKSEIETMENLARENPSLYFRRVLWQMVNALKSGADVGTTIKEIVDNLAVEQTMAIKKYGAQLNPIAMLYMVFCVIMPTLGITFLLVLGSFIGLSINMEYIFLGILGFLVFFQFMLIGMIKAKRPVGI